MNELFFLRYSFFFSMIVIIIIVIMCSYKTGVISTIEMQDRVQRSLASVSGLKRFSTSHE